MRNVGKVMSELRAERNMGQKELAILLNVSIGTISNYENNVHTPDPEMLGRIADIFGVTVDYLLGRTGYRCPPESLKRYITTDYTVSGFVNTILSLDAGARNSVTDFANYLKSKPHEPAAPPAAEEAPNL